MNGQIRALAVDRAPNGDLYAVTLRWDRSTWEETVPTVERLMGRGASLWACAKWSGEHWDLTWGRRVELTVRRN